MSESSERLKAAGNDYFKAKDYQQAITKYGEALRALGSVEHSEDKSNSDLTVDMQKSLAILYCNRSACYLELEDFKKAEEDAKMALSFDMTLLKAYYRLGKAYMGQKEYKKALELIENGLKIESSNKSLVELQLLAQARSKPRTKRKEKVSNQVSCDCTDEKQVCINKYLFCGGCGDNNVPYAMDNTQQAKGLSILRQLIEKLIQKEFDYNKFSKSATFSNTFIKLFDQRQYYDMIFPGVPMNKIQDFPRNLRELLLWDNINIDFNKIIDKASQILNNVKTKGAQQGDIMDEATENVLFPEIIYESFALELIDYMRTLSRKLNAMRANMLSKVASIKDEKAHGEQLEDFVITELVENNFAVQKDYMGLEWSAAIFDDVERYCRYERMSESSISYDAAVKSTTFMSYIDYNDILNKYPALAELVLQLQALPYEINLKSNETTHMLEPVSGMTMIMKYPKDSQQVKRLDNRANTERDSAVRFTCSYHLTRDPSTSFMSGLKDTAEITFDSMPIMNDDLIIYKSTEIETKRSMAEEDYYVIMYFIQAIDK